MRVKTRIFNLSRDRFSNLSQLAGAIGVSVSQVYRVKEGSPRDKSLVYRGGCKSLSQAPPWRTVLSGRLAV